MIGEVGWCFVVIEWLFYVFDLRYDFLRVLYVCIESV